MKRPTLNNIKQHVLFQIRRAEDVRTLAEKGWFDFQDEALRVINFIINRLHTDAEAIAVIYCTFKKVLRLEPEERFTIFGRTIEGEKEAIKNCIQELEIEYLLIYEALQKVGRFPHVKCA
jgi:hypothetical protein